jgi:type IV pilus assembly protein PilP
MSPRRIPILVAAALAAACGKPSRPPAATPKPAVAAPAPAAPEAKPAAEAEWSYSSVGKRDPFRSWIAEIAKGNAALQTRCATALGRFELEQLKLVAVVTGLEDPIAMVEAPNGVGYALRRGACIGKNGGVVAAVRSGEVVVSEWAVRADGTRDRSQTVLRLPKQAALNLEE